MGKTKATNNFTYGQNGKWEVTKWASHSDIHISVKDEYGNYQFVANCGNPQTKSLPHNPNAEGNANLIVSAVNACIKINSINPLAVAKSIEDMHEALTDLVHKFRTAGEIMGFTEAHLLTELEKGEKVLAKINVDGLFNPDVPNPSEDV